MKTVVAIGDSLIYGYPFSPRCSWVTLVAKKTGWEMVNKGICGETTGDMLLRFEQDVVALQPGWVIILGGTNDAFDDILPEEVEDNITAMLEMAIENGIIPIISLPPPVDFSYEETLLREYRQIIKSLADRYHLATLDFYETLVDPNSGKLCQGFHNDGVHPNELGYGIMAQAAQTVLARYLKDD